MKKETILNQIKKANQANFKNTLFGTNNSKLKKNGIISFDLPAGYTCPFAGECLKYCYAQKGFYKMPTVKTKYSRNYEASLKDTFVYEANNSLQALPNTKFVRVHSSGDYYNKKYIAKWVQIAKDNKNVVFYSYTKSAILFKNIDLPDNLLIIQSEGTKKDSIYINYKKTFARIFEDENELIEAVSTGKFLNASSNDLNAVRAVLENKNVALLKH